MMLQLVFDLKEKVGVDLNFDVNELINNYIHINGVIFIILINVLEKIPTYPQQTSSSFRKRRCPLVFLWKLFLSLNIFL